MKVFTARALLLVVRFVVKRVLLTNLRPFPVIVPILKYSEHVTRRRLVEQCRHTNPVYDWIASAIPIQIPLLNQRIFVPGRFRCRALKVAFEHRLDFIRHLLHRHRPAIPAPAVGTDRTLADLLPFVAEERLTDAIRADTALCGTWS